MRAAGVTEFGGPEALHPVEVPPEPLGPGQVRVRVQAAAVSPTDTHLVAGAYADRDPVTDPPWVPGMDAAGVVAEVGDGVEHLRPGDLAMGIVLPRGAHGAYREDLVLPGDSVVRAPSGARAETLVSWALGGRLTYRNDMLGGWRENMLHAVEKEAEAFRVARGYPKNWRRVKREEAEAKTGE